MLLLLLLFFFFIIIFYIWNKNRISVGATYEKNMHENKMSHLSVNVNEKAAQNLIISLWENRWKWSFFQYISFSFFNYFCWIEMKSTHWIGNWYFIERLMTPNLSNPYFSHIWVMWNTEKNFTQYPLKTLFKIVYILKKTHLKKVCSSFFALQLTILHFLIMYHFVQLCLTAQ